MPEDNNNKEAIQNLDGVVDQAVSDAEAGTKASVKANKKPKLLEVVQHTRNGIEFPINRVKGNNRENLQLHVTVDNLGSLIEYLGADAADVLKSGLAHLFGIWLHGARCKGDEAKFWKILDSEHLVGRSGGGSSSRETNADLRAKADKYRAMLKEKGMTDEEIDAFVS